MATAEEAEYYARLAHVPIPGEPENGTLKWITDTFKSVDAAVLEEVVRGKYENSPQKNLEITFIPPNVNNCQDFVPPAVKEDITRGNAFNYDGKIVIIIPDFHSSSGLLLHEMGHEYHHKRAQDERFLKIWHDLDAMENGDLLSCFDKPEKITEKFAEAFRLYHNGLIISPDTQEQNSIALASGGIRAYGDRKWPQAMGAIDQCVELSRAKYKSSFSKEKLLLLRGNQTINKEPIIVSGLSILRGREILEDTSLSKKNIQYEDHWEVKSGIEGQNPNLHIPLSSLNIDPSETESINHINLHYDPNNPYQLQATSPLASAFDTITQSPQSKNLTQIITHSRAVNVLKHALQAMTCISQQRNDDLYHYLDSNKQIDKLADSLVDDVRSGGNKKQKALRLFKKVKSPKLLKLVRTKGQYLSSVQESIRENPLEIAEAHLLHMAKNLQTNCFASDFLRKNKQIDLLHKMLFLAAKEGADPQIIDTIGNLPMLPKVAERLIEEGQNKDDQLFEARFVIQNTQVPKLVEYFLNRKNLPPAILAYVAQNPLYRRLAAERNKSRQPPPARQSSGTLGR